MRQLFSLICLAFPIMLFSMGCDDSVIYSPENAFKGKSEITLEGADYSSPQIAMKREASSEDSYSDIYNLNLFSSDRTYVEPEGSGKTAEPTKTPKRAAIGLPNFQLVGTLTSSGSEDLAFIKNSKAEDKTKRGKAVKYITGDWLGDYMISKIDSDRVVLVKGEETAYLRLKPPKNLTRRGKSRSRKAGGGKSKIDPGKNKRSRAREEQKKKRESARKKRASSNAEHRAHPRFSANESSMGKRSGCGRR